MKKLIVLFLIVSGCASVKRPIISDKKNVVNKESAKNEFIIYNYEMIFPQNDSMIFHDGYIDAKFSFNYHQLSFTIRNKSRNALRIFWNQASIDIFDKPHKIIHAGIKYSDSVKVLPATIILPDASIDEYVIPEDNIYFSQGYGSDPGSWDAHDLLISNVTLPKDSVLLRTLNPQQLTLHLPVASTDNKKLNYIFRFQVNISRME
ncbi:MAG: hypothetical protein M3139_09855 [Bacteroidota bacterium]|nr:hypothetical protein [Bacteroidota bacterium]